MRVVVAVDVRRIVQVTARVRVEPLVLLLVVVVVPQIVAEIVKKLVAILA